MTAPLYDDGSVRIDADGVTLRRYYFPWGGARVLRFTEIRGVRSAPAGVLIRLRLWGSNDFRTWLPLDRSRVRRIVVVTFDLGHWVRPACTPRDPQRVLDLLRERLT